jgi:hypothetical protein
VPLREHLRGHDVRTAFDLGWSQLSNGELLARAEKEFDVLVTTDRNLQHQQNLSGRRLAILVLPTTNWLRLQAMATLGLWRSFSRYRRAAIANSRFSSTTGTVHVWKIGTVPIYRKSGTVPIFRSPQIWYFSR